MRKPIGITVPYRAPTPEDEAFNEIERRSKVKQTLIVHKSKEAMLTAEVAVLTELARVLSDKVNELEAKQEQGWTPERIAGMARLKDLQDKKLALAKQEQGEPVAFKIYLPKTPRQDVNHGLLPWVYDQDPSSGNVASMWVTPVKNTPPQRTWVGLTEQEQGAIMESLNAYGTNLYHFANAIEAKLKEKNT